VECVKKYWLYVGISLFLQIRFLSGEPLGSLVLDLFWPDYKLHWKIKTDKPLETLVFAPTERKRFSDQTYLLNWSKNVLSQPILSVVSTTFTFWRYNCGIIELKSLFIGVLWINDGQQNPYMDKKYKRASNFFNPSEI
jgi:hypothetical protein